MNNIQSRLVLAAITAAAWPALAWAQSGTGLQNPPAPPPLTFQLKPVVITARHRAERAQSVPVSLTTVDSSQIRTVGAANLSKLQQLVPTLTIQSLNPRQTALNIRGLGSVPGLSADGLEGGVGVYVDGVLLARPGQALFDQLDLQNIEVLRGPQGTLFGKNTVAGAINITTRLPSFTPEMDGSISYGTQNYVQLKASASSALFGSDKVAVRLSIAGTQQNGFVSDTYDGRRFDDQNDKGIRAQLLYDATPDLTIRTIFDYSDQKINCCVGLISGIVTNYDNGAPISNAINAQGHYAAAGFPLPPIGAFARKTEINSPQNIHMETGGATVLADYDLNGYVISSITGVRYWNFYAHNDADSVQLSLLAGVPADIFQRQVSQELRLTSPLGGPVDYTGGLYYFYQSNNTGGLVTYGSDAAAAFAGSSTSTLHTIYNDAINGSSTAGNDLYDTNSVAAYGQATWHVAPRWDITGGLRYTYEAKTASLNQYQEGGVPLTSLPAPLRGPVALIRAGFSPAASYGVSTDNSMPSGLVTLSYKPIANILGYATYSHGAKSAGINLVVSPAIPKIVAPETIDNYEIGIKTTLLDERLFLDGDAFWEEDHDYQGTLIGNINGVNTPYISSIPEVRSRGFEIDSRAQATENLGLFFSGVYDNAYNVSNPRSPCPIEFSNTGVTCSQTGKPLAGGVDLGRIDRRRV
jgi:iron complex outermembrane receptor protein